MMSAYAEHYIITLLITATNQSIKLQTKNPDSISCGFRECNGKCGQGFIKL